ncbi:MAG: hypothetical protein ACKOYN_12190 [Planctomycetota bacterium]
MKIGSLLLAIALGAAAGIASAQGAAPPPAGGSATGATQAQGAIALSAGAETVAAAIRSAPTDVPLAILIDRQALGADETQRILYALADRRSSGGQCFAVGSEARGGAAIVALACDGFAAHGTGSIEGAGSSWCVSAAQREDISEDFTQLSRLDPTLANRLVQVRGTLSWSPDAGFVADNSGSRRVAGPGAALSTTAADLRSMGVSIPQHATAAEALQAIASGALAARLGPPDGALARGKSKERTAQRPGGTLGGAGAGGETAFPQDGAAKPPADASRGSPIAPDAATRTKPEAPAGPNPKLAPKVAEYATELATLRRLAAEFNEYYIGTKGVWTTQHKGVKEVWDAKADNTRHADTKLTSERLQRDMKEAIRKLESAAKSVARIAANPEDPEVKRMKDNEEILDGFRDALDRNKTSSYDQFYPLLKRLK